MNYLIGASIGIAGAAIMFLPSVLGNIRHVQSFRNISALNALAVLTLLCSLWSLWFLLATGVLWSWAAVLAAAGPKRSAQPATPPNGGPTAQFSNPDASEGPPSVS
jgi:hypothetical protein